MAKTQIRLEKETVTHIKKLRDLDPILKALSIPKLVNVLVVDGVTVRRLAIQKQEMEVA
jgi:hypothetical protein